ncbi:MAG: hypothetical protein U0270_05020 [Labilithrix sp.]
MRRLWWWSFAVGVAIVVCLACGSDHPPAASSSTTPAPEGGARALPAAPSTVADASREASDQCQACASAKCGGPYATCAGQTTCATCFEHFTRECFGDDAFEGALACSCGECTDCAGSCEGISCLRCVASACVEETDACTADPTCSTCLVTASAPGCSTNALVAALGKCTCERCGGTPGCHCP